MYPAEVLAENPRIRDDLLCVGIEWRLVRKWTLDLQGIAGFIWLRIYLVADSFERSNEPSDSIKPETFVGT